MNFLRQVCEDKVVMRDREVVRNAETTVGKCGFLFFLHALIPCATIRIL